MRNAVKAVIDAKTCAITLYAVDLNEPITAAWNAIYPGLLTPLSQHVAVPALASALPGGPIQRSGAGLRAGAHHAAPSVFFKGSDLFNIAQQSLNGDATRPPPRTTSR